MLDSLTPHPNVVRFVGSNVDDKNMPIIFEEFVDGPSLQSMLEVRKY